MAERATRTVMPDQPLKPAPERVLIADDEYLMATGLASSLRSLGYGVLGPVSDGEAAVELAMEDRPDLALMDIRMSGGEGLSAAERLWNEFGVPVVVVSAFSDQSHIELAQRIGVFGYLLKPVSTEHLRVTIAIAWARAVSHAAMERRVKQLETTLANRKLVEQAKWLLIERQGVTENEAHSALQRTARNTRRPISEVAEGVIRAAERGDDLGL